jgi:amino acid adenylation domain-containing protein
MDFIHAPPHPSSTSPDPGPPPAGRDAARAGALPCSFAQERLWLVDRLAGGSAAYHIFRAFTLRGPLNVPALQRALDEVVRRHETLRTTFREVKGAPVQVVAPFRGSVLSVDDLSSVDAQTRGAAVRARAAVEAERPFDLAAGPLFRATLLRLGGHEHVLMLCVHHVVADGWSLGVLYRELSALYDAFGDGRESPLPELPMRYGAHAARQRLRLRGEGLQRLLAFWKARLADAPALLDLPTDHPRPAVESARGASVAAALPDALVARLSAVGRDDGATLYMVLLAAFQVLLARHAGSADVVVGTPVAGRGRAAEEALIGFFANTLALRVDLSGDPPFREVLRRVRAGALAAYDHQELPFERLVAELRPERSLSHSPLFQAMFSFDADPQPGLSLAGTAAAELVVERPVSQFDLSLVVTKPAGGWSARIHYRTELFERATIERMLARLRRVLEHAADDPEVRLSALEWMDPAERALVVDAWNRTEAEHPARLCIHQLFERQAARTPDAVAVVCEHDVLTYAELNARANRLAHHLRRLGVGPESRAGVLLERNPDLPAALLAILKAGGAYVPLDPEYPAERLAFTLADSGVDVLVTQERLRGSVPVPAGVRMVSIDGAAEDIAIESAANPAGGAAPANLAYLIYTSGSTGRPKGVAIEHRAAVAFLHWAAGLHTAEELSGVLAATSICFDLSVFELFLPLSRGGRVILVGDAVALPRSAAAGEVRLINTVPSAIGALLESGGIPAGVKAVNLAGERLRAELVDALYAAGIERVHDLYGPSETTTYSTWAPRAPGGPETIGRPIANTRAYVLDAGLRPLPVGVPGELYLGGHGLARGYLGRPAMTAERFVPDPFGARAGGRLYSTGDRARWRQDGTLEYLGRLDAQVKVRGYRVEPGEIEAVLRRHPAVRDCAVAAFTAQGETRLAAYVVGEADGDALRGHLRRTLPEHIVPAAFVSMEGLPRTPSGKLDRNALPAPEHGTADADSVAPRTELERTLAEIWTGVLGVERIGVRDGFFALGGHSLLAVRVLSRIREALHVDLPPLALFESPTVEALAMRIEAAAGAGTGRIPPPAVPERPDALPLSFGQERLWFLDRLHPGTALYNVPAALRLRGALDVHALERALGALVGRHEALRTTFPEVDGAPVQVIAPFDGFSLPVEDLSAAEDAEREAKRRAAAEAVRPFDLAAGPLFRALLPRLGDDDRLLLITIHHIVFDGWSLGILLRELSSLYKAYKNGAESHLPPHTLDYADFALLQRERLRGEVLEAQLAYWRERLAGAPALLELPADHPRPAVESHEGGVVSAALADDVMERVGALSRDEGVTPFVALLAAFQVLLAKWTGSDDIVVGTPAAGRSRHGVEDVVGFFVNTLVLRTSLAGDPGFREVLRRAREAALGAQDHAEVPFEALVSALRPERSLGHAPLFQVMFAVDADAPGLDLPGVAAERVEVDLPVARFDLSLLVSRSAGGWTAHARYRTDLFVPATIRRMLDHLSRVLRQVAADPDLRLSRVETMGDAERRRVLEEWNRTGADVPAGCIHPLIAAQAARTPDAVALLDRGGSRTYREVEERANRLAHHLVRLGAGPEARVGVCIERGAEMVVALLAVLKAGAAYVPLDAAYPAERLSYMLRDSGASLLVTQRSLRGRMPTDGVRRVLIDTDAQVIAAEPGDAPRTAVAPENAAYVIYTSGSTGRPKGVVVTHANLANLFAAMDARIGTAPGTWLAVTRIGFDIHATELLWTLARGYRVVVHPDVERRDAGLADAVRRHGITHLQCTPSLAEMLIAEGGTEALAGLQRLLLGGEAMPADLASRIHRVLPDGLVNLYGPTETTVWSTAHEVGAVEGSVPIGRPLANARVYVLDAALRPQPVGVPGELFIGGAGVARGYLDRPGLTAERFLPDPFAAHPGSRLYRTGDRVRWKEVALEFLGRLDAQVKIRGHRVEPGEVEAALRRHAAVRECAIAAVDGPGETRLAAYVVGDADVDALRTHLRQTLPEYMLPSAFVFLHRLPLTPGGKLDRRALPAPEPAPAAPSRPPREGLEARVAAVWREVLGRAEVGARESFFEAGGSSLLLYRVYARLRDISPGLRVVDFFRHPTIETIAAYMAGTPRSADHRPRDLPRRAKRPVRGKGGPSRRGDDRIAVVGMSCRFPGARDVAEFWSNLRAGRESITFFSDEELLAAGVSPELLRDPAYVRGSGALADAYAFDAAFFGVGPAEARVMDPQHRVFLECAYAALEDAGCDPARYAGAVGVFAGSGTTSHYARVLADADAVAAAGAQPAAFGNAKEFLTTRVSHRLGLRGPSVAVGTACSTSLVAIHMACQALRGRECDLALAGGVTIHQDAVAGYLCQEGGILSPDGHCRAFDVRAAGTVFGSGAGVVALKRLSDALRDGDTIHAVVRGSAVNNDGAGKMSFTAPAVQGQARVIRAALRAADVDPSTVSYVEAHGTGTALGDPIEVAALREVFGVEKDRTGFCALGAVKTNVGHLDTAAGVAGFIKTVLALKHRTLPPTLHFTAPHPDTGLDGSPFFVNTEPRPWRRDGTPLRAGVSSFGFGGTNAHAVLEEAPRGGKAARDPRPAPGAEGAQLLVMSAKSEAALRRMRRNLATHLAEHPDLPLADVAHTLQQGRTAHPYRWAAVAADDQACDALAGTERGSSGRAADRDAPVAFLFPGQGTQYAGMARELYAREPVFRAEIDGCAELLADELGMDLRAVLFPAGDDEAEEANAVLRETRCTQPALFAVEYALARLWMSWGVRPAAMLGHSIGEYVAACLAGVFSLESALRLVAARGRLMQDLPPGAMLAVPLPEAEVRPLLAGRLSLAAVNAAAHCVVSGFADKVAELEALLAARGVAARRLHTSHAFHSAAMVPILDAFADEVRAARPAAPTIPFLSNVSGDWITAAEAADPGYWVRHLRQTVRFADGVGRLLDDPARVLLEVGPSETLGGFARRHVSGQGRIIVRSLPPAGRPEPSDQTMLDALGALWVAGVEVDWPAVGGGARRRKIPLPTYPFERTEYRVPPPRVIAAAPAPRVPAPVPAEPAQSEAMAETPSPVTERVAGLFAGLLGRDAAELEGGRSFVELGADSLLLMQASRSIETAFGVRVPFRQLLEGLSTVDDLAAHIASEAPDAGLPPSPAAAAPTPAAMTAAEANVDDRLTVLEAHAAAMQAHAAAMQAHAALVQARAEAGRAAGPAVEPIRIVPPARNGDHAEDAHSPMHPAARNGNGAAPEPAASHGPHRPVEQTLRQGGGFDERQARHFDDLVRRYTARTRRSREYAATHRTPLADNRASLNFRMGTKELLYPIVGERSRGSRMWDVDGNEYVDFTMGFGVHFFGHQPPFVMQAVEEQLRRGVQLGPQSDLAGPAAVLIGELTGMERAAFCNTGSEAVMTAVRVARAVTGRYRIVIFEGSYHGCFDGVLARRGGEGRPLPVAPGTPPGMIEDVMVLPYGTAEALEALRAHAADLAAVLVEPVQSRDPEHQPRAFLHELRSLTRRSGAALVFDEMISGFRLGVTGAQGWYGVQADLATYGKVVGGGFPIGVVAGSRGWMDAIDGGAWSYGDDSYPAAAQTFFAGTFCKHPVAMAAACAVLRHLREQGPALYEALHARAGRLVAALRAVLAEERVPMRIVHCGSIFHFRPEPRFRYADLLFHHLLLRGMYIWEGRACYLSTAHTDEDCDRLVRALRESVRDLRGGGFLPDADVPPVVGRPAGPAFPLTPAQQAILRIARLGDDASRAYDEQIVFGVRGRLDPDALRAAVDDLARHHEALRTIIDPSAEVQHVLPSLPSVPLRIADASSSTEAALEEALGGVFDLHAGPLFRVHVHGVDAERHVLQFIIHHLVADGVALAILRRDLEIAYRARRQGHAPNLPAAMQFSEYAARLPAARRNDPAREAEWRSSFDAATALVVPADHDGSSLPAYQGARERRVLDAPLTAALGEVARREGGTLFVTLLGGVLAVAHRLSGQAEGVVGISSAGRPVPRSDSVVGNCADVLPLRSRAPRTEELGAYLRDVRGWVLDACEREDFSWARLREGGAGECTLPPLPALLFNLEPGGGGARPDAAFGDLAVERVAAPARYARYAVGIDAVESRGEIHLLCTYDSARYERSTIARMLEEVERTLARATAVAVRRSAAPR